MAIRKRVTAMTVQEQDRFLSVIRQLINNPPDPNRYGVLVGHHAHHAHNMHPFMGPVGTERFLPWHRVFLLKVEQMGQEIDPLFFIPYWDWTTQREVPPWLINFKPTVKVPGRHITVIRDPGDPSVLPDRVQINAILELRTFTEFVLALDNPHGIVHDWCNGTMSDIHVSPVDPLFWLHHAQIDRIWSQWQTMHPNQHPQLTGNNSIIDPWPEIEVEVRSITVLGYSYGP
jgi:tyrosinase